MAIERVSLNLDPALYQRIAEARYQRHDATTITQWITQAIEAQLRREERAAAKSARAAAADKSQADILAIIRARALEVQP